MNKVIYQIGFWSGLTAFASTIAYCIAQILQLAGILTFPFDEILIYATSLCIVIPFLFEILCLHYTTTGGKRFWSHAALMFAVIYAVFVTANYVVQLATVIPNKLKGTAHEVQLLDQTPHSMFWNFDALGYIFMGLCTLAAVPVFEKRGLQKWARGFLLANAAVTPMISFVYFYPQFSGTLLYLGFPWAVTAPLSMLLVALTFKRQSRYADLHRMI